MRRRFVALVSVSLVLGFVLAGCADDEPEAPLDETASAEANTVSIDMKEYSYTVTGAPREGRGTFRLTNAGEELHMVEAVALREGKTLADARTALASEDQADDGEVFDQERDVYTEGTLTPGASQEVTIEFPDAGTYALVCFIPTVGDGAPHFVKGMIAEMRVAEGDGEAATPAEADHEVSISDGETEMPTTLEAGRTTFEVSADGEHEFLAFKLARPDVTFEQIDGFFNELFQTEGGPAAGYVARSPALLVAGLHGFPDGESVQVTLDLEPGTYLIGCALEPEGEGDGEPPPRHEDELVKVTVT